MPQTNKVKKTKKLKKTKKGKNRSRTNKIQIGGNLNAKFMDAIMEDNLSYIEDNIGNITDLSFENSRGETPLDIAVTKYNDLKTTDFMDDIGREMELYSIRTQIIEILLKNGANGENIEIPRINLYKANLKGANLVGANLKGANLEEANLEEANLEGANLEGANLEGANLKGAKLDGAAIDGTIFEETNLDGSAMDDEIFNTPSSNVFRTTTDLPQTTDNVFRTTTDLPQTTDNSDLNESHISSIGADYYENDDYFDISVDPQTPPYSPPPGNNNNFLLNLMDSYRENNYQSSDENQSRGRMSLSELETEEERNERLLGERNKKRQKYLQRPEITLTKNNTNPFENVGFSGYHVFEMEDVNFCDYIKEDQDNVIFIYDQQVGVFDKSTIRKLIITETLDETKIVYECNEISEAFVPYEENIISGPMLNMRILGINGLMIPLNELDAVVNGEHQIFVIETENDKNKIPIASLPTRLAMGVDESGREVVSADHCQTEVSIKVGNLSYIENRVLLDQCPTLGKGKHNKVRRKNNKTKRIRQKKTKRSRKNKKNKKINTKK